MERQRHDERASASGKIRRRYLAAMRADELRPSLLHEAALKNAPDAHGGFFRVPKVIDK